jgi:hypothetical protein
MQALSCIYISLGKEIFMKKRHPGRGPISAALAGVMLLCIALLGFTGCEDSPPLSENNKITAFKIGNTLGAIDEEAQEILVIVPAGTNLSALKPVVSVSAHASVFPASEEEVNLNHPVSYTVTAENGVSRTYTVTVLTEAAAAVLNSIQIQAAPTRTIYEIGESFSPDGLIIAGVYSDGSVREVTGYTLDPAPVPTGTAGTQTVTVSVGGKSASFTVSVRSARLESISATPLKFSYAPGEALTPAGVVVTGYYSDGTDKVETASYTVTGYDPATPGSQKVVVTLNGKTATFTVTVGSPVVLESISATPLKINYAFGEAWDPADVVVKGYYSDGTTKIIEDGYTVTGYESQKSGNQILAVVLEGKASGTFSVTVGVKRDISVTIGLPNAADKEPEIFGIPEGGIVLSTSQTDLPEKIVVSAAAVGSSTPYTGGVYSYISWFIDGSFNSSDNIITIYASNYTLKIPHYLTFVGTKDGVEYSRTITFTVNP